MNNIKEQEKEVIPCSVCQEVKLIEREIIRYKQNISTHFIINTGVYMFLKISPPPFKRSFFFSILELKARDLNSFCGEFLDKSCSKKPDLEYRVNKLAASDIRRLVGLLKRRVEYPVNRIFRRMVERKLQDQAAMRNRTENKEGKKEQEKTDGKRPKRKSKELKLDAEWSIDQPSGELWTNKYKPRCTEDMILNEDETWKLRSWLNSWTKHGSSSQNSSATSDSDVEDERIVESSCALLTGRSGCGKTAAVYALAEELGLHVLEVNASTCRTGKQVTSMLLEATQSQQVQAGQSRLNFFKPAVAQGTPTPAVTAQNKSKRALILFEDIDIVFEEQDRGFYSAVNSIAAATKRPIIFTSSDDQCLNLINKSIKSRIQLFRFESAMNPSFVATHLQLMCLAEGVFVSHSSLEGLVTSSRSIRECINTTQYMVESGYIQEIKSEIEDEEEIVKKPKKKFTLKKMINDGPEEGSEPQHQDEEELYLKFFQTKSSRGNDIHEYALEVDIGSEYSHQQFMDLLAEKVEYTFISRKEVYPLDDTDEVYI
ncbi:ATPase family AAA domain-containing protein 5 isoform X2 [Eurytemora carolleeae]|uniref:ATPase family AAA domain-containing protein 5 isoform X2 n=1 Tax=Eurytemora carolleeae TaxID=1294199 RepID=UPI000C795261|nr:ATPase family AAA domain-containing protein 5 isoform X2 [Eurytemora carolleeae]|eukprot:XP_023334689.1 ATPase family AAA domain-containing protein 5-like isoform X2 [Eurytemora affinis]